MALTAEEYYRYTCMLAPADFEACLAMAEQQLHAETLYAYVGRDMGEMPVIVQNTWKQALAMQTMSISQMGGVSGMVESMPSSVSLGKFSYSTGGGSGAASGDAETRIAPGVRALLPILVGYGRGLRACCQCP